MLAAVVQKRHGPARNWLTVHGDGPDTMFDTSRVVNPDSVQGGPVTIAYLEPRPSARHTRLNAERVTNRFDLPANELRPYRPKHSIYFRRQ